MQVIQDLAAEVDNEASNISGPNGDAVTFTGDIISQGLISYQEATTLMGIFQQNYGRWVGFSEDVPVNTLLAAVRKSDLLLCACCLISVRHTTQAVAERLAPKLFSIAKSYIASSLLAAPQPLEFFQAALLLCMWSTTVGQTPLSIDSWLLSGFALQHCLTSDIFDVILGDSPGFTGPIHQLLVRWTVWNHLCLVHLQ